MQTKPMHEEDIKCSYQIRTIDGKRYAEVGACDGADKNCPRFFNFGNCGDSCKYRKELIELLEAQQ